MIYTDFHLRKVSDIEDSFHLLCIEEVKIYEEENALLKELLFFNEAEIALKIT